MDKKERAKLIFIYIFSKIILDMIIFAKNQISFEIDNVKYIINSWGYLLHNSQLISGIL